VVVFEGEGGELRYLRSKSRNDQEISCKLVEFGSRTHVTPMVVGRGAGGTTEYLWSEVAVALIIETKEALRSRGNATIGRVQDALCMNWSEGLV
jgi:hypothetical protein